MNRTAKVTLIDPPSATDQLLASAAAQSIVKDSRGRMLTLKKPGVLAQYRLVEALGDSAKNEVYMGMVLPLIYVAAIDGSPEAPPTTKMEVEALIQQLDEEGIKAVMEGVQKYFGNPNLEADKATIKN